MRASSKAWVGIGVGVIAYDLLCPSGETLSEGVDRALEHPTGKFAAIGAVAIVGTHLLNILPEKIDPLHQVLRIYGKFTDYDQI